MLKFLRYLCESLAGKDTFGERHCAVEKSIQLQRYFFFSLGLKYSKFGSDVDFSGAAQGGAPTTQGCRIGYSPRRIEKIIHWISKQGNGDAEKGKQQQLLYLLEWTCTCIG